MYCLETGIEPYTYTLSYMTQSLENERMSVWYKQVYACKNVPELIYDGLKIKYKVK